MPDAELFTDARDTVAKRLRGIAPDRCRGGRTPSGLIDGDDAETIAVEVAKSARLQSGSGLVSVALAQDLVVVSAEGTVDELETQMLRAEKP